MRLVIAMKYSAERQRAIMAEAKANCARPRPKLDAPPPRQPVKYRTIDNAIDEAEPLQPVPQDRTDIAAAWTAYIRGEIANEHEKVIEAVGEAVGEALREVDDEFEELKTRLDQLGELLKSLRAEDRALDWPTARRAAAVN